MFLCCVCWTSLVHANADDTTTTALWRSPQNCGANCVYVWLRHCDATVKHDEVVGQIFIEREGASLESLKSCLSNFGLATNVVRGDPTWLKVTSKPFIAHVEWDDASVSEFGQRGHYVLVLDAGDDGVVYLDGTTGFTERVSLQEFLRAWTGLSVAKTRSALPEVGLIALLALSTVMVMWQLTAPIK